MLEINQTNIEYQTSNELENIKIINKNGDFSENGIPTEYLNQNQEEIIEATNKFSGNSIQTAYSHLKEQTPTNTPEALTSCLSDFSDEVELGRGDDTDSSDMEPISKVSGTSSFLPSSIDASESRVKVPASENTSSDNFPKKDIKASSYKENLESDSMPATDKKTVPPPPELPLALMEPPAGFTDSPVRNNPPSLAKHQRTDSDLSDAQRTAPPAETDREKTADCPLPTANQKPVLMTCEANCSCETLSPGPESHIEHSQVEKCTITPYQSITAERRMSAGGDLGMEDEEERKYSSSTGTCSRPTSRGRSKSRSRSRSKLSEDFLEYCHTDIGNEEGKLHVCCFVKILLFIIRHLCW